MKQKLNPVERGDLIGIPVSDDLYSIAQVQHPGIVFYIVLYEVYRTNLNINTEDLKSPVMGAWTTDGELHRKRWIGPQRAPLKAPLRPIYRVNVHGVPMIEDVAGRPIRKFDEIKDAKVPYRTSRSPTLVESFMRSIYTSSKLPPTGHDMLLSNGVFV
jgi:hypothetical protein